MRQIGSDRYNAGVSLTIQCPACGAVLPDTAAYCTRCGRDFHAAPLSYARPEPPPARRWPLILAAGIGAALLALIGMAAALFTVRRAASAIPPVAYTRMTPAPVHLAPAGVNHPIFSARQAPQQLPGGVTFYPVVIGGDGPGLPMQVYLYLPAGQHARHSLPCVFVAPAGSRLFHGMNLGEGDMPEHLPYAQAGFAVCAYELSGSIPPSAGGALSTMAESARQFMAVDGGVANAKIAIDYVLSTVPEVNPAELFTAGHSSAAVVALDVAAADHRIHAVAAYAPAADVRKRLSRALPELDELNPGFVDFVGRISPLERASDFSCPIFLFHAEDDANVPLADNQAFADALRAAGKSVQFTRVPHGGHYQSMIDQGIPGGIAFFKSLSATLPLSQKSTGSPDL